MPRIAPFDALVYDPAVVGPLDRVTTPPYDVISDEARRGYLAEPHNVIHLDLADGPEAGPDNRYGRAAATLRGWVGDGVLRPVGPGYHSYEMRFPEHHGTGRVRGLFCAMALEDWGGTVIPHERTMPGPLEDRLRLLRATATHLSAIYGTVAGPCPQLADLLDDVAASDPAAQLVDEQGVEHRVWTVDPGRPVARWLADEPLLIADGHHRYTTALAYRDERRPSDGAGPWDRILTLIVDAGTERVPVLPFHRIQLEGEPVTMGTAVRSVDEVIAALSDREMVVGTAVREDGGVVFRTVALPGEPPAVEALHERLLPSVDPTAIRFTPDAGEAVGMVRDGTAVAAYLLPATTPDVIRKVIQRHGRLPQKSTYFWPKPRTGLVLMPLDEPRLPERP